MTVYIVTKGDHAMQDYEIVAVRSDRGAADALAKQVGGYVRQWEVDAELPVSEPGWLGRLWRRLTPGGEGANIRAEE